MSSNVRQKWIAAVVAACAVAGSLLAVPARAVSPADVVLQAGARNPENPDAPYEYTKYYPRGADGSSTVRIHRNDVVEWRFPGFHSVTFLPDDSGSGENERHPVWIRGDEIPGTMAANEAWWVGTDCGKAGQDPCVVSDDSGFISSGSPLLSSFTFRARIDQPAGTTVRYHCTVHAAMHGVLEVVPRTTGLPTQDELDAQAVREIAEDTAKADALMELPASSRFSGGVRTWTVLAGAKTADETVDVVAYLGRNADGTLPLRISAGDAVEFVVAGQDPHTVTFPHEVIGDRSIPPAPGPPYGTGGLRGTIRCDLDGAAAGLPGTPLPLAATAGCPVGTREIVLNRWMTDPQGSSTILTNATYADSAIMVAADNALFTRVRPTVSPSLWPSQFSASFPNPGTFTYGCNFHNPFMTSSVEVV